MKATYERCKERLRRCTILLLTVSMLLPLLCGASFALGAQAAGKKITIPDPGDYFGKAAKISDSDENDNRTIMTYESFSSYPKSKVNKYIKALKKAGLDLRSEETTKSGNQISKLSINKNDCVEIQWFKKQKVLAVIVYDTVQLPGQSQKDSGGSAKEKTVSIQDGQLPDPGLFLNLNRGEDKKAKGSAWLCSYSFSMDNGGKEAVDEFVKLLQEPQFHLKLKRAWEDDYTKYSGLLCRRFTFTYTGSKSVGTYVDPDKYEANVYILANYYYDEGRIGFAFYFGDGLKLVDCGKHTSYALTDYNRSGGGNGGGSSNSGGGSTGGGVSPLPSIPTKCSKCHGDGKITCTNCDGLGYKIKYGSATPNYSGSKAGSRTAQTKETCFKCRGSGKITCPKCGG